MRLNHRTEHTHTHKHKDDPSIQGWVSKPVSRVFSFIRNQWLSIDLQVFLTLQNYYSLHLLENFLLLT